MDVKKTIITDYDWPESYVYVPWPVDKLTRDAISKERVEKIGKSISDTQKIRGR